MIGIMITRRTVRRWRLAHIAAAAMLLLTGVTASAGEAGTRASLDRDVLPLLKAHCVKCHGPIKPKGKLNLSNPRSMARGGSSGAVVVPGNPDESPLWDLVSSDEMPPKPEEPLSGNDKAILRRWIEGGAAGLPDAASAARTAPGADHWAFAAAGSPHAAHRSATEAASALRSIASSSGRSRTAG